MGQPLSKRWSRSKCCTCVDDVNQTRRTPHKVDDSHKTQTSSWLPPRENWQDASGLPYGWETAVDGHQKPYYIKLVPTSSTKTFSGAFNGVIGLQTKCL
ncbi:FERM and PDZ domain-containing protein 4 [Elysia marginata]|uniref:FERM and PDZ domain-containing protein 4 n=1 Tax=Elysia marginata TaxID=1093978 RepID=A0AAV4I3A8_9GAST|nr:FERM and PDZ domain-containing protein 4 [Elysia marginata]